MKIIKRGQTLEEWLLSTIHTCHVCHTTFQPERSDKYHIASASYAGAHVEIICPHCGKRLQLYKPNPDAMIPAPQPTYVPVPYPVYPSPPNPWYVPVVPTIIFGTGVGDGHIPGTTYIPSPTTVHEPLGWKSDGSVSVTSKLSDSEMLFNFTGNVAVTGIPPAPSVLSSDGFPPAPVFENRNRLA